MVTMQVSQRLAFGRGRCGWDRGALILLLLTELVSNRQRLERQDSLGSGGRAGGANGAGEGRGREALGEGERPESGEGQRREENHGDQRLLAKGQG